MLPVVCIDFSELVRWLPAVRHHRGGSARAGTSLGENYLSADCLRCISRVHYIFPACSFNLQSLRYVCDVWWLSFVIKVREKSGEHYETSSRDEDWKPIIKKANELKLCSLCWAFLHNLIARRKFTFDSLQHCRHNCAAACRLFCLADVDELMNVFNFSRTSHSRLQRDVELDMLSRTLAILNEILSYIF